MEKNNWCLKNGFIFFNCVFGGSGILFICLLYKTGSEKLMEELNAPRMMRFWVFAIGLVVISIFGRCSTWTRSKCCLIAFAVINGVGTAVMIIFGINVAVFKSQVMERGQSAEFAKEILKNDAKKDLLISRQEPLRCCGWTGVEDWGSDIPESCHCTSSHEQCKPSTQGSTEPPYVYSKSCGEIIGADVEHLANIDLGIFFGFAIAAMMCLIIAIKMIMQFSCHDNVGEPDIEMRDY
ncbi:tetraspanin-8-like [Gambusia affinis]|uniref:tetraspanin-8-like n=1 Tax=Gambusia affinis TaxID=33528 RepID=UPI001CDC8520|nr:tetraspanin-8-like [Gambusia affinis]